MSRLKFFHTRFARWNVIESGVGLWCERCLPQLSDMQPAVACIYRGRDCLLRFTNQALGEYSPRNAITGQRRLLVPGASGDRLHLPETGTLPIDALHHKCEEPCVW